MSMAIEEEAATLLEHTIEVINEGGWQREQFGDFARTTVPHCIYGALTAAAKELRQEHACVFASRALLTLMPELPPELVNYEEPTHPFERVFHWNDHIAKDADEVVHKLKEAAESLR